MLCLLVALCACGGESEAKPDSGTAPDADHAHTFGDWTTVTESTCALAGSQERVCDCGEKETQALAVKAHTEGGWITDKVATTTEPGKKHQVCAVCGATLKEETISVIEQAHTHSYGDWTVSKAATCAAKGQEVRSCTCGQSETREIAKTAHNYQAVVTAPTCTEKGYTTHTCTVCKDHYKDSSTAAKGHSYGAWTVSKAATCAAKGQEVRSCACGSKETRDIAQLAHTPGDWVVDKQATATQDGHRYQPCKSCGAKLKEETLAYGSQGLAYTVNSDGKSCTVTGIGTCKDSKVVIPGKIDGYPVTAIANRAFYQCVQITEITIPDGVTSIGERAFYACSSLTKITIPDSVTRVGVSAFRCCSSLTDITIPDSVTSIGDLAFFLCSSLTTIDIPNSVTSIGKNAFSMCDSLIDITIGNSINSIGESAFEGCTSLTDITIPESVTSIGAKAFSNCFSLTDICYRGTTDQWYEITLGKDWTAGTEVEDIHCTDGNYNDVVWKDFFGGC